MPKQVIQTDKAGPPLGAYSQGIRAGDFVFVTGCGPIDPATGAVRGETVEEQTELVISNIEAILEAGGATLADVVQATVHLLDETEFPRFNAVYARRFPEPRPVRTTVGSGLRQVPGIRVEINVTAYVGEYQP
jgi:2-iminobutanoate/2-iminopropanoate deaminase